MTVKERKDIFKSVLVLLVICFVVSAALAVVNSFTAPVTEAAAVERENAARRAVVPDAAAFTEVEADLPEGVVSAYAAKDSGGKLLGYVFTAEGTGPSWAPPRGTRCHAPLGAMAAIDPEGKILRVSTLDVSSETKTLGGRTASADYTDQYIGQDASLSGVSAISGATVTSTAYRGCIEAAFRAFDAIKEVGQ